MIPRDQINVPPLNRDGVNTVEPLHGVILEVQGPAIGPASQIKYLVEWYANAGTFRAVCAPNVQRWDDTVDVRAFSVGHPVDGSRVNGHLFFKTREIADHGDCQP